MSAGTEGGRRSAVDSWWDAVDLRDWSFWLALAIALLVLFQGCEVRFRLESKPTPAQEAPHA